MKRTFSATFAVAAAGSAMSVLTLEWVQKWFAPRFAFPMLVAAVGLPILATLCAAAPLRSLDTRRRRDRNTGGRSTRKKGRTTAAPAPLFAHPDRVRQAALVGAVLCGWVIVSTVLSPHPALALLGEFDNGNGAILTLSLVAAWAIGVTVGADAAQQIEWAILAAVGLDATVAVMQALFRVGLYGGRAPGMNVNPVFLGGFLIGGLWIAIHKASENWRVWGPGMALVVAATQVSGSRLAIILIPVALVAGVRVFSLKKAAVAAAFVAAGLALGIGISALGTSGSAAPVTSSGTSSSAAQSVTTPAPSAPLSTGTGRLATDSGGFRSRFEAWGMAAHAVAQRPVQGWGPGRFVEGTARYRTLRFVLSEGPDMYFQDAHNFFVEYATTTGVIGLLLVIGFLAVVLRLSGWKSPLAGFAILSLATHLGQPQHPELTPLCFLALGAAATASRTVVTSAAAWVKGSLVGAATLAAVVIAFGSIELQARPGPRAEGRYLRTARSLLPVWPEPLSATASYYTSTLQSTKPGALQAAGRWALRAAQREPYRANLWNTVGADVGKAGDLNAAAGYFKRALREDHWLPAAATNLGRVLVAQNRPAEAIPYFEQSLKAAPNQPAVIADLAKARQAAG